MEEKFDYLRKRFPHLAKLRYFVIGDGKTGTVTCWRSIMYGASQGRSSIHAHGDHYLWQVRQPHLKEQGIGIAALVEFAHLESQRKPLIISSFREPISRTISAFFENFAIFTNGMTEEEKRSPDVVCQRLLENFQSEDYHVVDTPAHVGGLDCYASEFAKTRGWACYETEHARVLLLKFEFMQSWPDAFKATLMADEQTDFKWTPGYLSSDKGYFQLYQAVKAQFQPTREALDKKFATHDRFLKHFYTEQEITDLKAYWYSRCK